MATIISSVGGFHAEIKEAVVRQHGFIPANTATHLPMSAPSCRAGDGFPFSRE